MAELQEIQSKYGNQSKSVEYDRFNKKHMQKLIDNVDVSIGDDVFRMAKVFPTFKLFFVEEGPSFIAMDDDVYQYSSVNSITVHKSREQAADTAIISLTNFLGHLDNTDFQALNHADATKDFIETFENKTQKVFEDMKVRPGTRIQLKMGYSSFYKDLDNVFTGKITEVKYGDEVVIIAQGYGVELLQPLGYDYWGKTKRYIWANPRNLVISMLKTIPCKHLGKWSFFNRTKRASSPGWERLATRDISEVDDNVYLETGSWWSSPNKWCTDFKIYHENAWEIIQDLERRFPGYVAAVVPFDERGTLFFGLPESLYFYTETKDAVLRRQYKRLIKDKGGVKGGESDLNQKIFRSYHLKTSENHIIANNIKIDLTNFFNRITVRYNKKSIWTGKSEDHLTVMADDTIDQEFWRTKVVFEENCENSEQAMLYALGHLSKHTKELYSGELVILGDASIKPHDVVLMYDNYTNMYGPIGVREVVHNFSKEEGFTTTIVPDLMVFFNTPLHMLTTMFGAFKAGMMAALSYAGIQGLTNFGASFIPGTAASSIYPIYMARLGWQKNSRQPIGIIPLIYDNKMYIAGFEGMKDDSWIERVWGGFLKKAGDVTVGWEEIEPMYRLGANRLTS